MAAAVVSAAPTVKQYQRAEKDAVLTGFVPSSVRRAVASSAGGSVAAAPKGGATAALVAAQTRQKQQKEAYGAGADGDGSYDKFLADMKELGALS